MVLCCWSRKYLSEAVKSGNETGNGRPSHYLQTETQASETVKPEWEKGRSRTHNFPDRVGLVSDSRTESEPGVMDRSKTTPALVAGCC